MDDARTRAWKTRRMRYGPAGHKGSYQRYSPVANLFSATKTRAPKTGLDDGPALPKPTIPPPESPPPARPRDAASHVLGACKPCGRVWSIAELPMPATTAATMMRRALCPRCSSNQVFMASAEQARAWERGEHP